MRRLVVGLAIISLAALALSWAQADDQEIAKEITERLKQEQKVGNLRDFDINLKVADGNVVLKGQVKSREQQKLALDVARGTRGVKKVISDLQIAGTENASVAAEQTAPQDASDGPGVSDKQIGEQLTAELKRLKEAGDLKGFGLGLTVHQGVVDVSGRVSQRDQLQKALELAENIPGVRRVINHVVVAGESDADSEAAETSSATAASDDAIAQKIAAGVKAKKAAGLLKGFDINLSVVDGVVSYTGQVASEDQMQLAVDLANATDGVREVVNKLVIAEPPAESLAKTAMAEVPVPSDAEISQRIAAALKAQKAAGKLSGFTLDIAVKDGIASCVGRVRDAELMEQILEVARRTEGVRGVVNRLEIASTQALNPLTSAPDDAEIAQRIARSLGQQREAGSLKDFEVSVDVKGGVVMFTGRVATAEQMEMALIIARNTTGVRDVVNQMQVIRAGDLALEPTPAEPAEAQEPADSSAADERIGRELTARLDAAKRRGNLTGFAINVRVERHNVWLQGRVSSEEQRQVALNIASRVPGVTQVINGLAVSCPQAASGIPGVAFAGISSEDPRLMTAPAQGAVPMTPAPRPLGAVQTAAYVGAGIVAAPLVAIGQAVDGTPMPTHLPGAGAAQVPARYDHPSLPGYAWPSYAAYPNYAAVTYPKQYSPTAWPYIGPFYPYPQVPLGWRKATLSWHDGWWQLNFKSK